MVGGDAVSWLVACCSPLPWCARAHAETLGSELGAKILMRLIRMEGQVPRLTNERPLMNQGGSWGASRNLAGSPGLRPWGSRPGVSLQPGQQPSWPSPLATWVCIHANDGHDSGCCSGAYCVRHGIEPFPRVFSFQLCSPGREALWPHFTGEEPEAGRRHGTSHHMFLLQLGVGPGLSVSGA